MFPLVARPLDTVSCALTEYCSDTLSTTSTKLSIFESTARATRTEIRSERTEHPEDQRKAGERDIEQTAGAALERFD